MAEVESIAAVLLADAARLEPATDVVLGNPDLIVAVGEIGGVDELQVVGQLLAEGEPRARVSFVRDERRLDPDLAQAGRLLKSTPEARSDSSCQIREDLRAGDLVLLAAHVVERAAGDEHGHDVGLGQRGIGGERGFGVAGRAGDRDGDVVGAGSRVEAEIERGHDAAFVGERQDAALGLVAPLLQSNLRAFEERQLAKKPRFVRRPDDGEVGSRSRRARGCCQRGSAWRC